MKKKKWTLDAKIHPEIKPMSNEQIINKIDVALSTPNRIEQINVLKEIKRRLKEGS